MVVRNGPLAPSEEITWEYLINLIAESFLDTVLFLTLILLRLPFRAKDLSYDI